jgi:hypothetical protein
MAARWSGKPVNATLRPPSTVPARVPGQEHSERGQEVVSRCVFSMVLRSPF